MEGLQQGVLNGNSDHAKDTYSTQWNSTLWNSTPAVPAAKLAQQQSQPGTSATCCHGENHDAI